jgi:hypothetical protein
MKSNLDKRKRSIGNGTCIHPLQRCQKIIAASDANLSKEFVAVAALSD